MPKFIDHAVSHVRNLFPSIYETRTKRGSYHFSLAYERNHLLAIGLNSPEKVDAKAFKLARKFNLQTKLLFPFIHSEEDLVGRLIGMNKIDSSLNIVVLRLNKWGELGSSKPCPNCECILKAYSLNRIWYSTSSGEIIRK